MSEDGRKVRERGGQTCDERRTERSGWGEVKREGKEEERKKRGKDN